MDTPVTMGNSLSQMIEVEDGYETKMVTRIESKGSVSRISLREKKKASLSVKPVNLPLTQRQD